MENLNLDSKPVDPDSSKSIKADDTPSRFLRLPAEIRNIIYSYFCDWDGLSVVGSRCASVPERSSDFYNKGLERTGPAILILNRQIRSEVLAILDKRPLIYQIIVGNVVCNHLDSPAILHTVRRMSDPEIRIQWDCKDHIKGLSISLDMIIQVLRAANTSFKRISVTFDTGCPCWMLESSFYFIISAVWNNRYWWPLVWLTILDQGYAQTCERDD